jgi:hypothetical protein
MFVRLLTKLIAARSPSVFAVVASPYAELVVVVVVDELGGERIGGLIEGVGVRMQHQRTAGTPLSYGTPVAAGSFTPPIKFAKSMFV